MEHIKILWCIGVKQVQQSKKNVMHFYLDDYQSENFKITVYCCKRITS